MSRLLPKRVLDILVNSALVLSVVSALVVWSKRIASDSTPAAKTETVREWRQYLGRGNRVGSVYAKYQVVVFGDYQCPACKALELSIAAARSKIGDSIAVTYLHAPLDYHPQALRAAMAADCAARQNQFWRVHDFLFEKQDSLGTISMTEVGRRSHINDVIRFTACLELQRGNAADYRLDSHPEYNPLRLTGTPLVLINGRVIRGAPPPEMFVRLIAGSL